MKKILIFAVLSLAAGTGALAKETSVAQSYSHDFGTGNVLAAPPAPAVSGAFVSRAEVPASVARRHHSRMLFNGQFDPDPNIRFQLQRERQENVEVD
jgi:hypothetical protein